MTIELPPSRKCNIVGNKQKKGREEEAESTVVRENEKKEKGPFIGLVLAQAEGGGSMKRKRDKRTSHYNLWGKGKKKKKKELAVDQLGVR